MKRTSNHSSRESPSSERRVSPGNWNKKNQNRQHSKRVKLEPRTPSKAAAPVGVMEACEFPKLDQSNPVHSRRIQQRRRMIAFGKNTAGYDEYMTQVPTHKRRPRCMKHPVTPDHTLDIPTKRWQGLVKAWRRSLHQYDPEDLMTSITAEGDGETQTVTPTASDTTTQARQIADATAQGLPVDLTDSMESTTTCTPTSSTIVAKSPTSVGTEASSVVDQFRDEGMDELDAWETRQTESGDEDFLSDGDDSDDELL